MFVETHFEHPKYITAQPAHEAGFDSFLTAKVLIRLSAKLETAGHYVDEYVRMPPCEDDAYQTAPEEGGVLLGTEIPPSGPKSGSKKKIRVPKVQKISGSDSESQGVSVMDIDENVSPSARKSRNLSKKRKSKLGGSTKGSKQSIFSHAGRFDLLGDLSSEEDPALVNTTAVSEAVQADPQQHELRRVSPPAPTFTMMPPFDSDFWRVYGNKLRVNGTAEGVCVLG